MSPIDPPKGDLAVIKAAAALLGTVGGHLRTDEKNTRTAIAQGVRDWHGERFQAFITAGAGVQSQLHTAAAGCNDASDVLAAYATAFNTATTNVASYARQASAARTAAKTAGPAGKPDPDLTQQLPGKLTTLEGEAEAAKTTLAKAAGTAAAAIDALSAKVAPVSSKLTPGQIRQQVNSEFHLTGLKGNPNGTLTNGQALALLGAAAQTVPLDAINTDGSVDYTKANALPPLPPKNQSPRQINDWWNNLSPMQQNALLNSKYAQLGNLDGIPVLDRDFANRKNLPVVKTRLTGQMTTLNGQEPTKYQTAYQGYREYQMISPGWTEWHNKVMALQGRIDNIDKVNTTLKSNTPAPHYLVGYQDVGNGRVIISTGNPDTAQNVSTYVPGMGTKLSGIKGGVGRADAMYNSARLAGSPSTATIAWYGYDAPQGLGDAKSEDDAKKAAPMLDNFESGLRVTHDGTFHNTVVAHSYGTTVTGYAASHGHTLDVDDIAFVASPGVTVDKASDLRLHGGKHGSSDNVYASTAEYDPIRLAEGINGGAPVHSDFGSHDFKSNPDRGHLYFLGWNASAHSAYWDPNSPSLKSMGMIIAGSGGETK